MFKQKGPLSLPPEISAHYLQKVACVGAESCLQILNNDTIISNSKQVRM